MITKQHAMPCICCTHILGIWRKSPLSFFFSALVMTFRSRQVAWVLGHCNERLTYSCNTEQRLQEAVNVCRLEPLTMSHKATKLIRKQ